MAHIMASVEAVHNEPDKVPLKEEASPEPHPTFGPHANTQTADFEFKKEIEHLLFKLNSEISFRQRTSGQIYQFDS